MSSVDHTLQVIHMLRDIGELRVKEVSAGLGISQASTHRIMAMLVYRGFAVRTESHSYRPGPAIGVPPAGTERVKELLGLVKPHLEELRDEVDESTNLTVLVSTTVRFLLTAESSYPSHAGDRRGFVLPAESSAAGRAILATKPPERVHALYRTARDRGEISAEFLQRLQWELRQVRTRGYAVSAEEAEIGIVSIAAPVRCDAVSCAISIAGPMCHVEHVTGTRAVCSLMSARERIERELAG
jgi:DNA-binding IclR family transcriptional regulator